jgi:predicted nucleotidyltransferase
VDQTWIPARLRESLAALVAACEDDPAVLAAWVGGSLARDTADDWSDVDLHLLVAHPEEFGSGITEWFAQTIPAVLADQIPGVPGGFMFVTPDWVHVDVIVHGGRDFSQDEFPARVLHDPQGLVGDIAAPAEHMVGEPYLPHDQIHAGRQCGRPGALTSADECVLARSGSRSFASPRRRPTRPHGRTDS